MGDTSEHSCPAPEPPHRITRIRPMLRPRAAIHRPRPAPDGTAAAPRWLPSFSAGLSRRRLGHLARDARVRPGVVQRTDGDRDGDGAGLGAGRWSTLEVATL